MRIHFSDKQTKSAMLYFALYSMRERRNVCIFNFRRTLRCTLNYLTQSAAPEARFNFIRRTKFFFFPALQ